MGFTGIMPVSLSKLVRDVIYHWTGNYVLFKNMLTHVLSLKFFLTDLLKNAKKRTKKKCCKPTIEFDL